jgi:hypothetical protein
LDFHSTSSLKQQSADRHGIESLKKQFKVETITLTNSSQESCNQLTLEKGYHGNSLKELESVVANPRSNMLSALHLIVRVPEN